MQPAGPEKSKDSTTLSFWSPLAHVALWTLTGSLSPVLQDLPSITWGYLEPPASKAGTISLCFKFAAKNTVVKASGYAQLDVQHRWDSGSL